MTSPGRYHLLLTTRGRLVQHGWWGDKDVARRKFSRWVGEYGSMADARIALDDEETGKRLMEWPQLGDASTA
jgi:hypothetical protein